MGILESKEELKIMQEGYQKMTNNCLNACAEIDRLQEIIDTLKRHNSFGIIHVESIENDGIHECPICYDNIVKNETIYNLKCKHKYHRICLLLSSQKNMLCPLCRNTIQ